MTGTSVVDVQNGERCIVERGTHAGKSGMVEDRHISKTGHVTITVTQADGVRFKTLARNVARDAQPVEHQTLR